MLSGQKIDIRRRVTSTIPAATVLWYNEIIPVDQAFITAGKVILAHTPISGSELVRLNGLVLHNADPWDYTLSSNEVIFTANSLLTIGDTFSVKYQYVS